MYRLGHRSEAEHHYVRRFFITLLVLALAAMLVGWFFISRDSKTHITNTEPVTYSVGDKGNRLKHFNEGLFTFDLPSDWKKLRSGAVYSYQSTKKYYDSRGLNIYVDEIPTALAVNRLLPVQVLDGRLDPDVTSENCSEFTSSGDKAGAARANVMAKWREVKFMCDLVNYNRNVTGTGSTAGVNTIVLSGSDGAQHKFFFTYTDHSSNPDYTIFVDMLKSFRIR